ncbi:DUF973 family protein [Acidianus sp. HS-5]|uniref:DUF973 family protein n=1 Tax=Acidianus sp. HS-5 TaxID=2886040 RepID=UPI001F289B76|nr:DUF973 family protein [Acidianus sp. HS-5]BDC17194.1 hypothetical protein HS5_00840 [Acidianus sp. HS-5]
MSISYTDGLKELREGSLYEIISSIIVFVGAIILIVFIMSLGVFLHPRLMRDSILGALAIAIIIAIIGVILGIIGIVKLRSGFNLLKNSGLDVSIGSTGATLILISLGLLILGFITILVYVGIFITIIAGILSLIGYIMLGLGFYNLGKGFNDSTVEASGILLIVGGIINIIISIGGILDFIAFILIYTSLGGIISRGVPYIQTQGLLGVIKSNGYAYLNIYSQIEGNIIDAKIEGTAITSTSIMPNKVIAGNNSITVYFGNVQVLIPNNIYTVTLTVQDSLGRTILIPVNVQYQPF